MDFNSISKILKEIKSKKSVTYEWDNKSTYVKKPPFFNNMNNVKINNISNNY